MDGESSHAKLAKHLLLMLRQRQEEYYGQDQAYDVQRF
jgi:hypothetical protein